MKGLAGYGRYDDDPGHVGCPRAKTDMTPCIARDGSVCLASDPEVCVGCGASPGRLLRELAEVYPPAREGQPADPAAAADVLQQLVREGTAELVPSAS